MSENISYFNEVRRKLVHLSSLWMPTVMLLFAAYRWYLVVFFALLLIGNLLVEHAYASGEYPAFKKLYDRFFGGMLRFEVKKGMWVISGGPYVFASAFLSLLLFAPYIAAGGMTAMLLGDTAAALVGRRFGRHKTINGKSIEGVIAFVAAAGVGIWCTVYLSTQIIIPAWKILLAAFAGSMVELFEKQLKIDDNFSIPVAVGAVLKILL